MNLIKSVFGKGKIKEGSKDLQNEGNMIFVQYGIEPNIREEWKKIIEIEKKEEFKQAIDNLIEKVENNSDKNGFFDSRQPVLVDSLNGFKLDDKDIYYFFFMRLKYWNNVALSEKRENADGKVIVTAIRETIGEYLGKPNSLSRNKRKTLTTTEFMIDESGNDKFIHPSIKAQKGQGSGLCTEMASIAHNLWILSGRESFFITSKETNIPTSDTQYVNDGHSFCIVNTGSNIMLCDIALNNFGKIEENPIETIKSGGQIVFKNNTYTNAVQFSKE